MSARAAVVWIRLDVDARRAAAGLQRWAAACSAAATLAARARVSARPAIVRIGRRSHARSAAVHGPRLTRAGRSAAHEEARARVGAGHGPVASVHCAAALLPGARLSSGLGRALACGAAANVGLRACVGAGHGPVAPVRCGAALMSGAGLGSGLRRALTRSRRCRRAARVRSSASPARKSRAPERRKRTARESHRATGGAHRVCARAGAAARLRRRAAGQARDHVAASVRRLTTHRTRTGGRIGRALAIARAVAMRRPARRSRRARVPTRSAVVVVAFQGNTGAVACVGSRARTGDGACVAVARGASGARARCRARLAGGASRAGSALRRGLCRNAPAAIAASSGARGGVARGARAVVADLAGPARLALVDRHGVLARGPSGARLHTHRARVAARVALRARRACHAAAAPIAYAGRSPGSDTRYARGRSGRLIRARRHAARACRDLAHVAGVAGWRTRGADLACRAIAAVAVEPRSAGRPVGDVSRNGADGDTRAAAVTLLDAWGGRVGAVAPRVALDALAGAAHVPSRVAAAGPAGRSVGDWSRFLANAPGIGASPHAVLAVVRGTHPAAHARGRRDRLGHVGLSGGIEASTSTGRAFDPGVAFLSRRRVCTAITRVDPGRRVVRGRVLRIPVASPRARGRPAVHQRGAIERSVGDRSPFDRCVEVDVVGLVSEDVVAPSAQHPEQKCQPAVGTGQHGLRFLERAVCAGGVFPRQ